MQAFFGSSWGDDIQSKYAQSEYVIEFEESSEIFTDSRTIDDGEKATIDFTAPSNLFDSNSGFGLLLITITYTETSGEFGDPCDTISADLSVTDVSADWRNENNELSGVSSDCEAISSFFMCIQIMMVNQWMSLAWTSYTGTTLGPIHLMVKVCFNWMLK